MPNRLSSFVRDCGVFATELRRNLSDAENIKEVCGILLEPILVRLDNKYDIDKQLDKLEAYLNTHCIEDLHPSNFIGQLPIVSKFWYAHPYDNSDIDDLISDLTGKKQPTASELVRRKISYSLKTLAYMLK